MHEAIPEPQYSVIATRSHERKTMLATTRWAANCRADNLREAGWTVVIEPIA